MKILPEIAERMKRRAAESAKGLAQEKLGRGLTLTLRRDGLDWVLSLTRLEMRPSDMEVKICRLAFGAPEDAELEGEEIGPYQVRRLRWVAVSQESLFEVPAQPAKIFRD